MVKRKIKKLTSDTPFEEHDDDAAWAEAMADLDRHGVPSEFQRDERDDSSSRPAPGRSKQRVSRQPVEPVTLDLHRLTVDEAKQTIRQRVAAALSQAGEPLRFRIVTGKGRHSGPDGGVLVRDIHEFVCRHYRRRIVSIDESPADRLVGDLPVVGHFDVTIKPSS